MPNRIDELKNSFRTIFGTDPTTFAKGPGRVDLLGIHTDYNGGFVLPVAVDRDVIAAGRLRDDDKVAVYSANFDATSEFSLASIVHDEVNPWSNYVRGVVHFLQEAGVKPRGMNIALHGNVPIGSGMSSSAAIEMAVGVLFQGLLGFEMSGPDLALIGQQAENKFVGVSTGIMDQFISRLGEKDHALFLDCRTLEYDLVPLDTSKVKLVICDTMKRRGLVDSEYDLRRCQCEEGVRYFAQWLPGIEQLRDVTSEDFERYKDRLPDVVRKRAQHIIYENERVLASREVLRAGHWEEFGEMMNASHDSATHLYEVGCFELDAMAEAARNAPGAMCNRMAGAGFGGCSVSLVRDDSVDEFVKVVSSEYQRKTGVSPSLYVCTAQDGARVMEF